MYVNIGLIGYPLHHTLSPLLHTHFLDITGLNGGYTCYETQSPDDIPSLIDMFKRYSFSGINVTVPYKTEIIKYCDYLDVSAEKVGAVNTLHFKDDKIYGYNTDVYGFGKMLEDANISLNGKKVLLLGAGGAARAVAEHLRNTKSYAVIIANRSIDKAESLIDSIGIKAEVIGLDAIADIECDVVVNSTSIGLNGESFPLFVLPKEAVIDLQYKPACTPFLWQYRQHNIKSIKGFSMLVWQACRAFSIWTGSEPKPNIEKLLKAAF